ncbi:MAG TPA: GNAT family N-acetyltransferase [Pelolinea sp.]|nr:GNAT family N-acetyltransferase [Pelolinea sp.]
MEIKIHHDISEISTSHWNHLLSRSEIDVPFLRYGYLKRWWDFRGGGEWPEESQLHIISGWDGETLSGIAPLFSVKTETRNSLYFLGSIEISDYLDFICPRNKKDVFINLVINTIVDDPGSLDQLVLMNIPQKSTSLGLLEKHASTAGWKVNIESANHTPAIPLADNWDSYLAGIDKKQRHEIRRKLRRAEEYTDTVIWYIVSDATTLNGEIDAFFRLMEMDEEKKAFLTPKMRDQMRSILNWAFEKGFLQLSFLQIDGEKAAGYLCFDYQSHILVYNSGFDYSFSDYSPGWVLLSYLIQYAIETGKTHFDFMRGDETYKYRFGAEDGFVMKAVLSRP